MMKENWLLSAGFCGLLNLITPFQAAYAQANAPVHLSVHDAAFAFGMRPSVIDASLSPDGTKLVTIEANGARGSAVRILDLTTATSEPRTIVGFSGDPDRLDWCRWSGAKRLMCDVYGMVSLDGQPSYFNRLMAVDADGGNIQVVKTPGRANMSTYYTNFGGAVIDWNTGKDGHVLVIRRYAPEFSTGTKIFKTTNGLGVDDVDTANLHSVSVENPKTRAADYVTDGVGHVRVMGMAVDQVGEEGYSSGHYNYLSRAKSGSEWVDLAKLDSTSREGFNPHFVDPQSDAVYGLKKLDGRLAAYSMSLDGTKKETLLLSRPDVDITGFATIGRNRRVIGVTYSTDQNEVAYLDPQMKALAAALSKAMPKLPIIRIVDSSQDEKKLLIWAGSDINPGPLFPARPDHPGHGGTDRRSPAA